MNLEVVPLALHLRLGRTLLPHPVRGDRDARRRGASATPCAPVEPEPPDGRQSLKSIGSRPSSSRPRTTSSRSSPSTRATTDELAATNEELVAANEELQSTNEELQSAKEELQSTNEELSTVNDQLRNRNQELDQVASDLVNVLASVEIPVIIVDLELRVRRFTPTVSDIASFIPEDVGRPIDDLKLKLQVDDLAEPDQGRHRRHVAQGVGGPGPGWPLVPHADPALPHDRQSPRRRGPLVRRRGRPQAGALGRPRARATTPGASSRR